jgi:hypothetical protein
MLARELKTGREIRQWYSDFGAVPPYDIGEDSLIVCYSAIAEMSCHLVLGWPVPKRILDLYVEFRRHKNGMVPGVGSKLIQALEYFGLPSIEAAEKDEYRQLAIRGAPFSEQERQGLLNYCATDTSALEALLKPMLRHLDLPRALYRGRYMAAAAAVEFNGVPIDVEILTALKDRWDDIKDLLIADVDQDYGCYDGRTFKQDRFEAYLERKGIAWPRLPTGKPSLTDNAFRQMAKVYPQISALRELRSSLAELRFSNLEVGSDGRNRYALMPFASRTGRNQPSSTKANGAEMMRLACCLGIERGVEICAPVHDAFLICAPLDRLGADVAAMQAHMAEASRVVLDGFELRSDAKLVRYPDRYMDEGRGRIMWDKVMGILLPNCYRDYEVA